MSEPVMTKKSARLLLGGASALAFGVLGAADAWAQVGAPQAEEDGGIEEIVVTATKREALAQDLGISLSVLSGEALESQGIQSTSDLADSVPNLEVVDSGGGFNQVEIRGIADISTSIQTAPTVGVYVDEHSVAASGGGVPDLALFDAQRVEVLRGPQGTLFGDGSLSGTVRVVTNAPDLDEFVSRAVGQVSTTDGGGTNYGVRGLVNVPLIENVLALRVVAGYRENSGWYDNPVGPATDTGLAFICGFYPCPGFDPISDPDVADRTNTNDEQVFDARLGLRWNVTDRLQADLSFNHSESDVSDTFSGVSRDIKDTFINEPRETLDQISGLTLTYDFGPVELTSATSYYHQTTQRLQDSTRFAMPLNALALSRLITSGWTDVSTEYNAWTEELRLASTGDNRFDWTLGYFYRSEERDLFFGADGAPSAGFDILNDYFLIENESYAVFGEAGIELTDQLELTAGVRYFETERSSDFKLWGALMPWATEALAPLNSASASEDNLSYRVVLNWRPSEDVLLYANASSGFRAGGSNATAPIIAVLDFPFTVNEAFDAETMQNYELGAKTMWLDDRLQLNAYVFQMDWDDVQVNSIDGSGLVDFFFNAGRARSRGVEIEWLASLSDSFELGGGMAFLEAEYLDSASSPFVASIVSAGNQMPRAPEFQFNLRGSYNTDLGGGWTGTAVGSFTYQGETFSDASNTTAFLNDAASIFDLRLGAERGNVGVFLFGENITDEDQSFSSGLADVGFLTGIGSVRRNYRRPRTIGVEIAASF